MLTYQDACTNEDLYAVWLTRTFQGAELGERVAGLLRDGGYRVAEAFAAGLARLQRITLAEFSAANSPFDSDDARWLAHCGRVYPADPHPSETVAERNGSRSSWPDPG